MDEPEFFLASEGGKVHILGGRRRLFEPEPGDDASAMASAATSMLTALCGVTAPPGSRQYVGEFEDERLCARCYHVYPGEKSRLFERE